jgi:hypothetical protein
LKVNDGSEDNECSKQVHDLQGHPSMTHFSSIAQMRLAFGRFWR